MLALTPFKVLTFDCYGTMIDWETGIFSALRPILAAPWQVDFRPALLELYSELEASAEKGEFLRYRDVLQSVVRGFGERLRFSPTDAEVLSLPESLANWQPFPDTVEALRKLKSRYQLAVISNVDDDLFATTAPKLGVAFDQVITAQQARCYKPCIEFRTSRRTHRRKPRPVDSCRPKHLSRRNSRAVLGHRDGVGEPAFTPPQRRSR